jgi:hypothetical protein
MAEKPGQCPALSESSSGHRINLGAWYATEAHNHSFCLPTSSLPSAPIVSGKRMCNLNAINKTLFFLLKPTQDNCRQNHHIPVFITISSHRPVTVVIFDAVTMRGEKPHRGIFSHHITGPGYNEYNYRGTIFLVSPKICINQSNLV